MISDALDIERGMDVLSMDGNKIGTVRESWPRTQAYGHVARSMMEIDSYGVSGTRPLFAGIREGYVQVQRGGIFSASQDLFVPFEQAVAVVPGESVMVKATLGESERRFSARPELSRPGR